MDQSLHLDLHYFEKSADTSKPLILALGFFDCLHIGHRALMQRVIALAKEHECIPAFFTFSNNPFTALSRQDFMIYNYDDRLILAQEYGLEAVISAEFNETCKNILPEDFLKTLFRRKEILSVVCGDDYTYGQFGRGNTTSLKRFCLSHSIMCDIVHQISINGQRVSSTMIRKLIAEGRVDEANTLLGRRYFLRGTVVHGRGVGNKHGVPTVNFLPDRNKVLPANGVYGTSCTWDGERRYSVTNVGSKPTFHDDSVSVETYLNDYSGNLYGRELRIEFHRKLRDVIKFETAESLYRQINSDKQWYLEELETESHQ